MADEITPRMRWQLLAEKRSAELRIELCDRELSSINDTADCWQCRHYEALGVWRASETQCELGAVPCPGDACRMFDVKEEETKP